MKRWLLWLVLVLAVGIPGLLLLQFAITDARDYGDPWLKLAVPFLAASAIFMVLCGRARSGRGAILGAALALAFAGSSFWRVHSAIAARAEQRATVAAIEGLGRICSTKAPKDLAPSPLPTSRALPVYELDKNDSVRTSIDPAFRPWHPTRVSDAALVACMRYTRTEVETCNYDGGAYATRFRRHMRITIVDTKTGAPVATVKLAGEPPRKCSDQETFTQWAPGVSHYKEIEGPDPSASQIADALRPFVAGAR